jgi:hypothetical protein
VARTPGSFLARWAVSLIICAFTGYGGHGCKPRERFLEVIPIACLGRQGK